MEQKQESLKPELVNLLKQIQEEQNNMVIVYSPPTDEYTFTLPTDATFPINSLDADIYFKQYAYGEMTVTSATALSSSTIQLRDANGFYIDKIKR